MLLCLAAAAVQAQWVNYPSPGLPRGKDGKVLLNAPAPRTKDGKPDLSGVWHVQPTGLAEMKRLFGNDVDALDVPGMEAHTISKYGISVLVDFKPEDSPLRKEVAEEIARNNRHETGIDNLARCLPGGIPLGTMLSEFTKIVQTPGLTLVMHDPKKAETPKAPKPEQPDMSPQEQAMMKQMMGDMTMKFFIVADGGIKSSNATYREGNKVTLIDMEMGKLMENPETVKKLRVLGEGDSEKAMEVMKGINGVKVETQKEVTIELE